MEGWIGLTELRINLMAKIQAGIETMREKLRAQA
jgi:hypothetical protein